MNSGRYLPFWSHRVFNGLFAAALTAGLGTCWLGESADSWRHIFSTCLLWSSVPLGLAFAAIAHRFSIVEGLAGDVGYEEDESDAEERLG